MKTLRVFVRQPFTESGNKEKEIVQGVLDVLRDLDGDPYKLVVPNGFEAQSQDTFREAYERDSGKPFTPQNFRATRLSDLHEADVMLVIRTGLSESGSFEVAYNIFGGRRAPMFFAVWAQSPIKTTLLRELQEIADATYATFQAPSQIEQPLREFLDRIGSRKDVRDLAADRDTHPKASQIRGTCEDRILDPIRIASLAASGPENHHIVPANICVHVKKVEVKLVARRRRSVRRYVSVNAHKILGDLIRIDAL